MLMSGSVWCTDRRAAVSTSPRAAERLTGLVRPRDAVIRQVTTKEPKTVGARGIGAGVVSAHAQLAIREIVVEPVVEAQALEEAAQVDVDGGEELAVYERLRVVRIVRLLAGSPARRHTAPDVVRPQTARPRTARAFRTPVDRHQRRCACVGGCRRGTRARAAGSMSGPRPSRS